MSRIPFEIAAEQGIQTSVCIQGICCHSLMCLRQYSKDGCVAFKRTSKGSEGTLEIEGAPSSRLLDFRVIVCSRRSAASRHGTASVVSVSASRWIA
eukprot:765461-Hanusia_phi.AAC.5